MNRIDNMVAKLLFTAKVLGRDQLEVIKDHVAQYGGSFHKHALGLGLVSEEPLVSALASALNLSMVALSKMQIDPRTAAKLPGEFCLQNVVFPCAVRDKGQTLWLAMGDPTDGEVRKQARQLSGMSLVRPLVGRPSEILAYVREHYDVQEMQEADPFGGGGVDLSLSEEEEEEEFKIVSAMGGNTLVKHVGGVRVDVSAGPVGQQIPSPVAAPAPAAPAPPPPVIVDPALVATFDRIRGNQQKATTIITQLTRLLMDKGLFSADELNQMMKK
ncbi:MAG: hypothetical protein JRF33_04130 [Deltaproteobacteria bacterium]|nr:hypothetical protein [Deltaproteobacteria bacterium]